MATVTVPGGAPGAIPITYTFNTSAGLTVAQQIANALGAALTAKNLTQTVSTVSGSQSTPVSTVAGGTSDLVLTTAGPSTVTAGSSVAGANIVTDTVAGSTVTATAGVQLMAGTVGGTFFATGAGAMVGALGGNNTITATASGETIGGGNGNSMLVANAGGDYIASSGTDTIVIGASTGTDTVALFGSTGASLTGGGANMVVWAGNNDTISAGTGASTIFGATAPNGDLYFLNSSSVLFVDNAPSSGLNTIEGGSGPATIFGSGPDLIVGGSGPLTYITSGPGSPTIVGGTSQATLFGGAGVNITFDGTASSKGALFSAGAGNETLNASGAAAPVFAWGGTIAGANSDVLIGGSGADTLESGTGTTTMTGGGGSNMFGFIDGHTGGGSITITDMNSSDTVALSGYGVAATQAAIASATGSSLTLSDGTTITFKNVTVSSISSDIKVS